MRTLAIVALLVVRPTLLPAADALRLNVLLITVDDMNWDSVGAYGCPVEGITPHIDRLASQGMRFEHAHVNIAICQPTRAVWMTGRYPHRNGALGFDPINDGVPTLLEALHDASYFTGLMAKVPHVIPTRRHAWDVIVPADELSAGRSPQQYAARSAEFFTQAKHAGRPFFLMANSQDPHRPFAGSAHEQQSRSRSRQSARQRQRVPQPPLADVPRVYALDEITVPGFLPDLPDVRRELAEYFTSVHRADETVGAVLASLEASGLADETLVMFLSDHGMPLPFAKTNCYLNSTRTPWIVRWPGVVAPGVHETEHMISGIDLAPTVLEAVGLPNLEGADGRSFMPVLRGQPQSGQDVVYTSINRTAGRNEFPMRSVVTRTHGYIWNGWSDGMTVFKNESQAGLTMNAMRAAAANNAEIAARVDLFLHRVPEEFYDYHRDPDALHNLIADPRHAREAHRLRTLLHEHMKATADLQLEAFERTFSESDTQ
jgi:N-sulfoglucosamine sulfohydrolase